ncbi:MAG: sigma-70 family RNA polymerase sigma factor [Planctomycetes bacterium]|nr:sigma-70 family RNA polymerase sigma factor [Planctomycetota bacterium]MBL7007554.1 sigma-70 family RNA polymerase sigma factor [Planctomycetota bacterium]
MLSNLTTRFVGRLRAQDPEAWFELWDTFGPVLRAQIGRWGYGWVGPETVQDLSQETLAALSNSIHRHDPAKGARFSTWVLAIAKHVLGDELDRRMAKKRGSGRRPASLDESWSGQSSVPAPDSDFEAAMFRAKVESAVRKVERATDFLDFSVFRMRVLDGRSGKEVAEAIGMSEPTVSRRLKKVRDALRVQVQEVLATFSFTDEEVAEARRNGLELNPNKADDSRFDDALAEILLHQEQFRRQTLSESSRKEPR